MRPLLSTAWSYGTLADGQNALISVLKVVKNYVGQENNTKCDELIAKIQNILERVSSQSVKHSPEKSKEYFHQQMVIIPTTTNYTKINKTILILTANPKDTSRLRLDEEVREIDEGLRRSKHRDQFKIKSKWAVRLRDLRRALLDENPQIVHFCGHANVEGLNVEDEKGKTVLANPEALAGLFKQFPGIECVLLNACYSEVQAKAIHQHGVYVIGMGNAIHDKAALEFTIGFYDALGAGRSIEDAFEFGCNAIELYDLPDAAVPMLNGRKAFSQIKIALQEDDMRITTTAAQQRIDKPIEFVNRLNEIAFITNIYCPPYLLISAPSGYGKSRLLENIQECLQQQEWRCFHLRLSRDKDYSIQEFVHLLMKEINMDENEHLNLLTPENAGDMVSRIILKTQKSEQKNVVIMIDEVEALEERVTRSFLNQFIPTLKEGLSCAEPPLRLRLICAGRQLAHWKLWGDKLPLELLPLTAFDFPAVYETVEKFAIVSDIRKNTEYQQDFAASLMHFTGGHPGCMVEILPRAYGINIRLFEKDELMYYQTFAKPIIEEIYDHISEHLKSVFERLSVLRLYNYPLLQDMLDQQLINYRGNGIDLEDALTATYLVSRKNGIVQDDIVRRLFALKLRKEQMAIFLELCANTHEIIETHLQKTTYQPHSFVLEALFQELQLKYYMSEQTLQARQALSHQFFAQDGILQKNIKFLLQKPDARGNVQNLLNILRRREDWELQFVLNYFLRDGEHYTDKPYQHLLRTVEHFLTQC
jgi:hypothetical protein